MSKAAKMLARMRGNPKGWRFSQVERVLVDHGFTFRRQRGSDRIYKHEATGVRLFISWHGSGPVKRGYVRRVLTVIDQTRKTS